MEVPEFIVQNRRPDDGFWWWGWHPNFPWWSRSCWGGATKEEAYAAIQKPMAVKMRLYHLKLIQEVKGAEHAEGIYKELCKMQPCEDAIAWLSLIQKP